MTINGIKLTHDSSIHVELLESGQYKFYKEKTTQLEESTTTTKTENLISVYAHSTVGRSSWRMRKSKAGVVVGENKLHEYQQCTVYALVDDKVYTGSLRRPLR